MLTLPPKVSSKKLQFLSPFSPLTILTKMNKKKKERRREKGEKKTVALGSGHENQVHQDEK